MSSTRVPLPKYSNLTDTEKEAYDFFSTTCERKFGPNGSLFLLADPKTNELAGPFPPLVALPSVYRPHIEAVSNLGEVPGISGEAREVAILTVCAHNGAAYDIYSHKLVATKTTALTQEQVDSIVQRQTKPSGLDSAADAAYDIAAYLMKTPGPLPQELWNQGLKEFGGVQGMLAFVSYVAYYAHMGIFMNAVDVPVPKA